MVYSKSLIHAYSEIKDLFTNLFNEKGMFYFNVTSTIYVCDLNIEKSKIHKMKSCNFLVSSHTYDPIEIISSLSYDQHNLSLLDYVDEKIKIITITILVTIEDLHILNAVVKIKKNLKYLFVFIMVLDMIIIS